MSQTLAIQDPSTRHKDPSMRPLVRSWEGPETDVAWVQVAGELDLATAPALGRTLRGAECRARLVVLDLRELTFTDSCGVRVLSHASSHALQAGRRLVLVRGPAQVDRMMTLMPADAFEIVDLDPGEPLAGALLQLEQRPGGGKASGAPIQLTELTVAISAAMVEVYTAFYGPGPMTASTYIKDKIVACVLESPVRRAENRAQPGPDRGGDRGGVDAETEDGFCAAIERLTHRRVVAFMSQDQTSPGVACELFFLDAAPLAANGCDQLAARSSRIWPRRPRDPEPAKPSLT
jgi:anti-sigma B factor antagonist